MPTLFQKIITSSADPQKTSLAVKGILVGIAPVAMYLLGMTDHDVNSFIDAVGNIVFFSLSIVAAIQVVIGVGRKVKLGRWSSV